MSAMDKASADLKLAEFKLQNLRKSFQFLKSQSSPVSSIALQWQHIETHFKCLNSSLIHRLQVLKSQQPKHPQQNPNSKTVALTNLQSLCLNMDPKGLRLHLNDRADEHELMREELALALRLAPNAPKLVLDAVKGFCVRDSGAKLLVVRRSCLLLLEELMKLSLEIGIEVREEAKKVAKEWMVMLVADKKKRGSLGVLGIVLLIRAFGVVREFKKKELLGLLECVCRRKEGPELVRMLGLVKKMPAFVHNLINKKLHLEAIRYIYAFGLVDKFSPVALLKAYLEHIRVIASKIRRKGILFGSEDKTTAKEVAALKAMIRCIVDHNLESEYSTKSLGRRIERLEKKKAGRKHVVAASITKDQLQQQRGKKRKKHIASGITKDQPKQQRGKKCKTQIAPDPALNLTRASSPILVINPKSQKPQQSGDRHPLTEALVEGVPNAYGGAASTIHFTQPHYWQSASSFAENSAPQFNAAGYYGYSGSPSVTHHMNMNILAGQHTAMPLHRGSLATVYGSGAKDDRATAQFALAGSDGSANIEQYRLPGTHSSIDWAASINMPLPYYVNDAVSTPGYCDTSTFGSMYGLVPQYHPSYHPSLS